MTVEVYDHAGRLIEKANADRVKRLAAAPNAQIVRKRSGQVVQINLKNHGDDSNLVMHRGNPRRYSHDHENVVNPPRVWTMRKLGSNDPQEDQYIGDIYRLSVLDNLKKAA